MSAELTKNALLLTVFFLAILHTVWEAFKKLLRPERVLTLWISF